MEGLEGVDGEMMGDYWRRVKGEINSCELLEKFEICLVIFFWKK